MTRAARRRDEREADKPDTLRLQGADVVLAVAVKGAVGKDGGREYQTWVRGPQTGHNNGDMVGCLSMLASTIVLGSAQGGRISVQQSIDECKRIFAESLQAHVHRKLMGGVADGTLKTVLLGASSS